MQMEKFVKQMKCTSFEIPVGILSSYFRNNFQHRIGWRVTMKSNTKTKQQFCTKTENQQKQTALCTNKKNQQKTNKLQYVQIKKYSKKQLQSYTQFTKTLNYKYGIKELQ